MATTLFFFGSLRDRALLEIVLDRAVEDNSVEPAWVTDHATMCLAEQAYPYLAYAPGARAEGAIVHALDESDVTRLQYFEDIEYALAPLKVETSSGPVDAQYFRSTGLAPHGRGVWSYARWQSEERAVALEAATEHMAHMGHVPIEQIDSLWEGIMIRARMRARAKAEHPVTGTLRAKRSADDVESIEIERPYTRYFAIEEQHLRHRRFDGEWSKPILRTAVTSGDAVTVIPYDPRTDRVLLIEQFRAPMFARGDACPWAIEVIAGRIDKENDAETCARREAKEEAGLTLGRMEVISRYYSSPGFAAEHLTAFAGEADLGTAGGTFGVAGEDEDIRAFTTSLDEAIAATQSGEINVGPAILSILWLGQHRARLQQAWAENPDQGL